MLRIVLVVAVLAGCGGGAGKPTLQSPKAIADAAPAIAALQASRFGDARQVAGEVLARDAHNSRAAAVRALATYQTAGDALVRGLGELLDKGEVMKMLDHEHGVTLWRDFLGALEAVDRDLTTAGADPQFSLELCLACWTYDWNRNGQIDDRDRRLFEIEYTATGEPIDQADPGRRPTFRFDAGDIEWARAMISFQRAAVELILAYRWTELDGLFKFNIFGNNQSMPPIVIHLADASRVKRVRELVLAGLDHADRSRAAYLAEADDDREWVPSPTQRNHPVPLPMDARMYATWQAVIGDVRRMLKSEEGISLRALATALEPGAALVMPDGYIDLGAMLREPKDIVIDLASDAKTPQQIEKLLRGLFGNGYRAAMKVSPLIGRLARIKQELEAGSDTFGLKLRYLLWLN